MPNLHSYRHHKLPSGTCTHIPAQKHTLTTKIISPSHSSTQADQEFRNADKN